MNGVLARPKNISSRYKWNILLAFLDLRNNSSFHRVFFDYKWVSIHFSLSRKIFLLFYGSLKEHLVSQITSTQKYSARENKKKAGKNMKNFISDKVRWCKWKGQPMTQKLENKFNFLFVKKKCAVKGHCGEDVEPSK